MVRLDKDSMDKWTSLLPGDLKGAVDAQTECDGESLETVVTGLKGLTEESGDSKVEKVLDFVFREQDAFAKLDRARRVRFIAWVSGQPHSMSPKPLAILFDAERSYQSGEDEDGGDGGTMEKIAPVFLQDVREIMAALGPRATRSIVDSETLGAVTTAGFEAAHKTAPIAGGV